MKNLLALLLTLVATALPAVQIILPQNATAPEKTAAEELAKYIPLLSETPEPADIVTDAKLLHPAIHIGKSPAALTALGLSSWDELKPDEVCYAVTQDGDLWLAGEGTRGTIYSIYELLEQEYGVRFLTAKTDYIPKSASFALPPVGTQRRYAPQLITRGTGYFQLPLGGPEYMTKCRNNFLFGIPEEWGKHDNIIGFCHTFDQMLPEKPYFQEHPEWFSLRKGVREGGSKKQLCLTNQEMRQELIKKALERLRKDGGKSHYISISQNDNVDYCECDECNKFVQEHGNQTDLLMDCVNAVADAVKDEFPNVYVETLAYQYTRQPPKTILPRDNVAVQYCTIEAKYLYPIESQQNNDLYEEILAWRSIAKKMLIWNYVTFFGGFHHPHPNWHNIEPDLRFFLDSNAICVFEQGPHNNGAYIADLDELRTYIIRNLLWNPELSEDALRREFCELYYGPTGALIAYDYIGSLTALAKAHPDTPNTCSRHDDSINWMSDQELATLWKRIYNSVMESKDDPVYGPRIEYIAMPLTMDILERRTLLQPPAEKRLPELQDINVEEVILWCEKVLKRAEENGLVELTESKKQTATMWLAKMKSAYTGSVEMPVAPSAGPRPAEFDADQPWWGWNIEELSTQIYGTKNECAILDDPNAVGGKAARMPTTHTNWYVQATDLPRASFDVYLTLRCDVKPGAPAEGNVISCGNYDGGKGPWGSKFSASEMAGDEYKLLYLGRQNLVKCQYFYCAPQVNPNTERIWIDRIIVTNPQDADGNPIDIPAKP